MRIEIDGPGKLRVLGENGEDLAKMLNIFKIEIDVEAQSYPTAVLHCCMLEGFSAEVDYANVMATVIYSPEVEGKIPCSFSSPRETE